MSHYDEVQSRLASGWNTFNTFSVFSHVLMPEGIALNLLVKDYSSSAVLHEAFIGSREPGVEEIRPGVRTWDGAYTELDVKWKNLEFRVETGTEGEDFVMLVTPVKNPRRAGAVALSAGMLWNRTGLAQRSRDGLIVTTPKRTVNVYATRELASDPYFHTLSPYLVVTLEGPVGFCTGKRRRLAEIEGILKRNRAARAAEVETKFGGKPGGTEVFDALQSVVAWNTVFEPLRERVVSPVSRIWSAKQRGGYVLFCWDTFFAASMAATDNRDIAYANAVEILTEVTEEGFVPNNSQATGRKSRDRSQPPVGGLTVWDLYEQFGDKWLLEKTYAGLLRWNRWWRRRLVKAEWGSLLAWGSHPFEPVVGDANETFQPNTVLGATLESGLDNSPMYVESEVVFDAERHVMLLHDVGLNGLYIADCRALAKIAGVLGHGEDAAELNGRADALAKAFENLWDEKGGIYRNRRTDTGDFSMRVSPTLLYGMIGGTAPAERVDRMIREHLFNENELGGEWLLPSIARNDAMFGEMEYWRGPVWGPLNWLVYVGLRNYSSEAAVEARRRLAENSRELLLKGWREHRHVYENYHAVTGDGYVHKRADPFYHWGALLGLIGLRENA